MKEEKNAEQLMTVLKDLISVFRIYNAYNNNDQLKSPIDRWLRWRKINKQQRKKKEKQRADGTRNGRRYRNCQFS